MRVRLSIFLAKGGVGRTRLACAFAVDRAVVDAPAAGHGIHFLAAPDKTARILAGPLRARAEALGAMLKDPAATDVVLVTLAEEMPVREALEMAATLRAQGFTLDNLVV